MSDRTSRWEIPGDDPSSRRRPAREPKRRPVLRAVPPTIGQGPDPAARMLAGEDAAGQIVRAGHAEHADVEHLVALADEVGLDALAALWSRSEPGTLPAALWALYAMRSWCRARPRELARLVTAGRAHAEVAAGVAGLPEDVDEADIAALGDDVVRGAVSRDLATALARAAAFARVVAAGRGASGDDAVAMTAAHSRAAWAEAVMGSRLLGTAEALDRAAARAPGLTSDDHEGGRDS
ncbi:MAG TPA: hypothetical protein VLC50_05140 [Actinomycetes bacterium]|nr:hypothetical protein [Actinomycetes bacterium]